ncbi:hypothetical protein [Fictibacillus arsenicus]|uniref:Uncharacterized protein n=1 Tax=Fictibacillus arsenicus TaxID=255247 RepID=A0A1V3GCC0_9BACL|nr:hypothetical protein [Fictibacillus arsenicus]OOE14485.1 hypothetical protein UN64_04635 [Fictibacillus arsenicus]
MEKKMMDIMLQVQQSVLELRDDVNVIKADVADLKVRVTNIEENMVRKSDLKYYNFKIAEHDRDIFQLKQQN